MKQTITLGMPHLNYNGLDPIWLSKTLGDNHWSLLKDVKRMNQGNERLYASFFAIEIDFNKGQHTFNEYDSIEIDSKIFKFNNMIYRSHHFVKNDKNAAQVVMDSIFVKKDLVTGSLVKDEPVAAGRNIESVDSVFMDEHKRLKKEVSNLSTDDFNLLMFSPETYFNGVKILYCANYFNLALLNEYVTYKTILPPLKKIKLFFFRNISEHDQVYGRTTNVGNEYQTILISNNKPIGVCISTR